MVRDTLAVPPTGAGVERQFSLSGAVVTSSRGRLIPETIEMIMMHKNKMHREKRSLVMSETAGLGVGEELVSSINEDMPKEWRDQWWKERKRQRTV